MIHVINSKDPCARDARADVCVIGAGIAGLSTACLLAIEGRSVILIDDGQPGRGQTGLTSAHLSNAIDDLTSKSSDSRARRRVASPAKAIARRLTASSACATASELSAIFVASMGFSSSDLTTRWSSCATNAKPRARLALTSRC
jgi:2-polyprenyl-6-methoxyphenol hydroxylase-like FAD-dependent oxidoreductase